MKVKEYLNKVAYKGIMDFGEGFEKSEVWYSKFDNSYITHVGMEKNVKFLADREITEELTHGVGFSPKDGKWYGWSHRAIYGFAVGSTCKKGDCHYRAANLEDEIEDAIRFWTEEYHKDVKAEKIAEGVIQVSWTYSDDVPNETLRGTRGGAEWNYDPQNFGRGEWVAQSMDDAKQMAIDFNKGVS